MKLIENHTNIEPTYNYIQFMELVLCLKSTIITQLVGVPYSHAVLNCATTQPVVEGQKQIKE